MFPKRAQQIGSFGNSEWRCCLCLHVRTATILLGIWHLMIHVLALSVLAMLMRNTSEIQQNQIDTFDEHNFLPTPLSKVKDNTDNPYYLAIVQNGRSIYSTDVDMGALVTLCRLIITMLMLYGAVKNKAVHLLPFFCLQLFDFATTIMTATGYFCYVQTLHQLGSEHIHNFPFKEELLKLSPQTLRLIILVVFIICLGLKAYFIGVVWRCYKYITLKKQINLNRCTIGGGGEGGDQNGGMHLSDVSFPENVLRNDCESGGFILGHPTGVSSSIKQTPPPSYQDVVNELPPPYQSRMNLNEDTLENDENGAATCVSVADVSVVNDSSRASVVVSSNVVPITSNNMN